MKFAARIVLVLSMLIMSVVGIAAQDDEGDMEETMAAEPAGTFIFVGDSVEITEDTIVLSDVTSSIPFIYEGEAGSVFDQFETVPLVASMAELAGEGVLRFNIEEDDSLTRYELEVTVTPTDFDSETGATTFSYEVVSATRTISVEEGDTTVPETEELDKLDDLFASFDGGVTLYVSGDSDFFDALDAAYAEYLTSARPTTTNPACTRGC